MPPGIIMAMDPHLLASQLASFPILTVHPDGGPCFSFRAPEAKTQPPGAPWRPFPRPGSTKSLWFSFHKWHIQMNKLFWSLRHLICSYFDPSPESCLPGESIPEADAPDNIPLCFTKVLKPSIKLRWQLCRIFYLLFNVFFVWLHQDNTSSILCCGHVINFFLSFVFSPKRFYFKFWTCTVSGKPCVQYI